MRVAVCEDEPLQAALLKTLTERWAAARTVPITVECFPTAESFLFCWEEDRGFDLLILDIQMPGRDGLTLAREVRRGDRELPIVFVTGFPDFMGEGYEVSALHYLLKPVDEEKLFNCLDRALGAKEREQPLLLQDEEGQTRRVYQRDVKLLEASLRWVELFHTGGSFRVRQSFQALLELLDPGLFVRCHRSYVVGLEHMAKLSKAVVTLDDGTEVPVSRRLFPQVSRAFVHYYHGEETL